MVETNQGNWGYAIVGMTTVMVILAIVFVSARVATRIWISKSFWWDDVTIILALVRINRECSFLKYLRS